MCIGGHTLWGSGDCCYSDDDDQLCNLRRPGSWHRCLAGDWYAASGFGGRVDEAARLLNLNQLYHSSLFQLLVQSIRIAQTLAALVRTSPVYLCT